MPIAAVEFVDFPGGRADIALVVACPTSSEALASDALVAPGQHLEVWDHEPAV